VAAYFGVRAEGLVKEGVPGILNEMKKYEDDS